MNERTMELSRTCIMCGKNQSLMVRPEDYLARERGALAQDAYPYLSADDRELLISGVCGICYDKMFDYEENSEEIE